MGYRYGVPRRFPGVAVMFVLALVLVTATGAIAAGWIAPRIAEGFQSNEADKQDESVPVFVVTTPPASVPAQTSSTPSEIGVADGYIPDGEVLSPFDTDHPAIANLDPDLLAAVQQASIDAEADGVVMVVNSGWRSERYQQSLLDEAIVTYGGEAEARKWVKTPDESTHVTGQGVDIGYTDADYWLIEHGYLYGLCQTYANEIWHFELAVEPGEACPPPLADATG